MEEIEERETHVDIIEEISIDEESRDEEYSPQTSRLMDSRTGRNRDTEYSPQFRWVTNSRPEGNKDRE